MLRNTLLVVAALLVFGTSAISQEQRQSRSRSDASQSQSQSPSRSQSQSQSKSDAAKDAAAKQEKEIRALIEQLVFDVPVKPGPVYAPGIRDKTDEYRKNFERCSTAFAKLMEYKAVSIPLLVEHLDDKRQSINFRNHDLRNSVGHACYLNIYYQLQDRPRDYSRYGHSREGRDGDDHVQPYWEGTPFDDDGGVKKWLKNNENLSYVEKRIKCLKWLLEKEKAIGAPDPESYFINILPLEIRILERRLEAGEDVKKELERLREVKSKKLVDQIPAGVLPTTEELERGRRQAEERRKNAPPIQGQFPPYELPRR